MVCSERLRIARGSNEAKNEDRKNLGKIPTVLVNLSTVHVMKMQSFFVFCLCSHSLRRTNMTVAFIRPLTVVQIPGNGKQKYRHGPDRN